MKHGTEQPSITQNTITPNLNQTQELNTQRTKQGEHKRVWTNLKP